MQNDIYILIISVLLIFFLSCTYTPNGNNYYEIDPPPPPVVSISLAEIDSDTLDLASTTRFEYIIDTENPLLGVQVLVNNQLIYEKGNSKSGSFSLDPESFNTNIYTLELNAIVKSNSGSLADDLSQEAFLNVGSWTLRVDRNPPTPVQILPFKYTDEGLEIKWTKYERANFLNYSLNFHSASPPYNRYNKNNREFDKKNLNKYVIENYNGQKIGLSVTVETNYGVSHSDTLLILDENPKFYPVQINQNYQTIFSWQKSKFPSNFSSYKLERRDFDGRPEPAYYNYFHTSTNLSDTSHTINALLFGRAGLLRLRTSSKDIPYISNDVFSVYNDQFGEDFDVFPEQNFKLFNNEDSYLKIESSKIQLIGKSTGNIQNTFDYENAVVSKSNIIRTQNDQIILNNKNNPAEEFKRFSFINIIEKYINIEKLATSWESNRVALLSDSIYVIDFQNESLINTLPRFGNDNQISMSSSGELILINEYLLSFDTNDFQLLREPLQSTTTLFRNKNNQYFEIVKSIGSLVDVFAGNSRTPVSEFTIYTRSSNTHTYHPDSDAIISISGHVHSGIPTEKLLVIYKADSNKQINIGLIDDDGANYLFLNNTLISTDGYKLELPN